MKIKSLSSWRKVAAAALFEKRLVIQKLIDRALAKKMSLNGQKTHFYRLQAVLEATLQRLYNDMRRLEVLERKRLYTTTATKKLSSSSHCKTLKKDFSFFLDSSSCSLDSSSSSSSSSEDDEDDEILQVRQKQKHINDDSMAIDTFFQSLTTAISKS